MDKIITLQLSPLEAVTLQSAIQVLTKNEIANARPAKYFINLYDKVKAQIVEQATMDDMQSAESEILILKAMKQA